ncbi:universal stress protein [Mycolicibacterium duvalii]|uniref:Universal stress protein n=1 Tax=Mycolicibacterium duvalii TaxID=39688 RepID=A0A7I7K4I7_9MYCO|nr:universal stress protein [Mycolicibacterium duvalii]MCV7367906.1 universal stress protein [Mycolicibacterium duvalii]PEG42585.1 universal stress protein [Mycolicibacterium duvalii]BBX18504.1 universal stress protein [Mycolicibacterium duvalii]
MSTKLMVGYDGSPAAGAAITAGSALFPRAHAWVTHIWAPPFASVGLRRRLRDIAQNSDELATLVDSEGAWEAESVTDAGVALARAAGWAAEKVVERTTDSDGMRLAQLAEQLQADALVIGDRGLDGTKDDIGGVCDMTVHYATVPVLVVPDPLLRSEFDALADGPVLVGYDRSDRAEAAIAKVRQLFPGRRIVLAAVRDDDEPFAPGPAAEGLEVVTVDKPSGFAKPRDRLIAEALIACADDHNAAVVAVAAKGHSAVREVLLGSVAVATVRRCHRPVLVVHG